MVKLEQELKYSEKNRISKVQIFFALLSFFSVAAGIIIGSIYWMLSEHPQIKAFEVYKPIESSYVYSSEGELFAELYLERRTLIPSMLNLSHV